MPNILKFFRELWRKAIRSRIAAIGKANTRLCRRYRYAIRAFFSCVHVRVLGIIKNDRFQENDRFLLEKTNNLNPLIALVIHHEAIV